MFTQIEEIRKEGLKKFWIVTTVMIVLTLLIALCFRYEGTMMVLVIGMIADVIVISLMYERAKKKYMNAYKNLFLKEVLTKEFDELRVNFEQGFTEDQIRSWHLVSLYDRFYSDDYISGKLHGIPFECSDIKIEDVVKSGKSTTVVTRFQGLYLKLPLKKSFQGWMVVREKEFLDNGNPRGWFSEMPQLEKIQVEDELFNQRFSIYASDGTEAFYLLTPRFLEELKRIESRYKGRCMFGFLNGDLHMAIDSRQEHFDVSLFEAVNEYKINQHKQEVQMIKGMIELIQKECEEA